MIPWIGFEDVFHLHDNLNFYKMIKKKKNTKYYRLEEGQFPIPRQFPNFHEEIFFFQTFTNFQWNLLESGPKNFFTRGESCATPRRKGDVPSDSFDPCRSTRLSDLTVYIVLLVDVFVIRWLEVSTTIKA